MLILKIFSVVSINIALLVSSKQPENILHCVSRESLKQCVRHIIYWNVFLALRMSSGEITPRLWKWKHNSWQVTGNAWFERSQSGEMRHIIKVHRLFGNTLREKHQRYNYFLLNFWHNQPCDCSAKFAVVLILRFGCIWTFSRMQLIIRCDIVHLQHVQKSGRGRGNPLKRICRRFSNRCYFFNHIGFEQL